MRILELGGEVRFGARLTKVLRKGGRVAAVRYEDAQGGHVAARRSRRARHRPQRPRYVRIASGAAASRCVQKPFSIGARIEHPQSLINVSQYGAAAGHPALGAADYKLALHLPSGRSAYTFCMCPGGTVVAAASEPESVVTNGMSCVRAATA